MVSPAHADDTKTWTELKFSGDKVTLSFKIHLPEQYGVSTKSLCEKSKSEANSTKIGKKVDKIEVEQYEGVEVCTLKQWETQRGSRRIRLIAWFLCYP